MQDMFSWLLSIYVCLFSRYSGGLYVNSASQIIDNFDVARYALMASCFAILILSFFMLIRPTTLLLARTINQVNSMMLLLPPSIRHKEMIVFISENMSSDWNVSPSPLSIYHCTHGPLQGSWLKATVSYPCVTLAHYHCIVYMWAFLYFWALIFRWVLSYHFMFSLILFLEWVSTRSLALYNCTVVIMSNSVPSIFKWFYVKNWMCHHKTLR